MSRFWSETVKKIKPYVPGEQPQDKQYIKLNTNENPYPPSPGVIQSLKGYPFSDLRLYPDPVCRSLADTIASYYEIDRGQIFIGNGSDEVLAFCFPAYFNPGDVILFPDITYSFYPVYSSLFGMNYRTIPVDKDFMISTDEYCVPCKGILIPNPNAPTGIALPLERIEELLIKNSDSVVVIDEAYVDFGSESSVSLINKYGNLLVVQTCSKSRSLAGMRLGFAMGNRELIEGLERVKNSFNSYTVDRVAQVAARQAFLDDGYFRETVRRVMDTREYVKKELNRLGFGFTDSKANFLFASHKSIPAGDLFRMMRDEGILVRHFSSKRIDNYLRISIGTDEEMKSMIEVLYKILYTWK